MKVLLITAVTLFSANTFACKMTPVGYTHTATNAALEALSNVNTNTNVNSIFLHDRLVEIRSEFNGVKQKNVYSISIKSDCSVVTEEVQPGNQLSN